MLSQLLAKFHIAKVNVGYLTTLSPSQLLDGALASGIEVSDEQTL